MNNPFSEIIKPVADIIECYRIEYSKPAASGQRTLEYHDKVSESYIGHSHGFYQYIYVEDAQNGYITIAAQKYSLTPGMLYMIKPGVLHIITGDEPYKIILTELKFTAGDENINNIIKHFPDMIFDNQQKLLKVLTELNGEYKNSGCKDSMMDVKLLELMLTIQRICNHSCTPDISKANIYEDKQKQLIPVLDYITENFASEIPIETLAKIAHMEKGYFTKQFKKYFDITPGSYIQSVRLNRALNMLEYADMSVEAIAGEVGFANVNSFIRAFKAKYNRTPKEYRNAVKIDIAKKYKSYEAYS